MGFGAFVGDFGALFLVAAIILIIGKAPKLKDHPKAVHWIAGAVPVGISLLLVLGTHGIYDDMGAMLLMLASFWLALLLWTSYRRAVRAPKSGWLRIGAALTLLWAGSLTVLGLLSGISGPWVFFSFIVGPVAALWLIGFAFSWIRRGFERQ
jgi:hypothetical protein